jgi:hypothetical protein
MATSITGQDMTNWLWKGSDPNTQYRTYDPKTGQFSADFGGGTGWGSTPRTNGELGIQGELFRYLQAMGYTGPQDSGQAVWDDINTPDPLTGEYKDATAGFEASKARNPELEAFLQSQGLSLQEGIQHTPGASQKTWIQRLVGADGNPVAVDAYNDRYSADDRFTNLVQAGIAAAGAAAAGSAAGLWDLGAAGAGTGAGTAGGGATLGGGASGAGAGVTASLPSGITSGLGLSNAAPIALAPSITGAGAATAGSAAAAQAAAAGMGAGAAGLGAQALPQGVTSGLGLSNAAPIGLAPSITGTGAATAGSAAALAAEAAALGGAGAATNGTYWDLLNSGEMGAIGGGSSAAGGSVLEALKAGGSGLLDGLGGAKNLAPVIGAIAGASEGGKTNTISQSSKLDPVMQQYLYGTGFGDQNSFLGAAQNWFNQNKSGTNADMTAGMNQLRNLYSSPEYTQGYQQMRGIGQGLLSSPVAGNPFTQGLLAPPQANMPQQGMPPPQVGIGQPGLMYAGGSPNFYGQPEEQQTTKVPRNLLGIGGY